jgi:hypothetical protein
VGAGLSETLFLSVACIHSTVTCDLCSYLALRGQKTTHQCQGEGNKEITTQFIGWYQSMQDAADSSMGCFAARNLESKMG